MGSDIGWLTSMAFRNSLQFRLITAFVILGALLAPLMTLSLLFLSYKLEENAIEADLEKRLDALLAAPRKFPLQETRKVPELRVLTRSDIDALPVEMLQLEDGMHEFEPEDGAWLIAIATTDAGRLAVVEDISLLERRESIGLIMGAVGTMLGIYVALWLGYYFSRRLLAPLRELATRVAADDDRAPLRQFAPEFGKDEVGALAATIDRYRMRMARALQREREFSADASHELRTPLAVIQNAAEIIEEDGQTSERSRRAALRIANAATRMNDTVSTLLLMVREAQPDTQYEEVSVADCIESCLQQQQETGTPIKVEWHKDGDPRLRAPRAAIDSIVGNLIRNAFEHSGARNIALRLEAGRFVVTDDGVGIDEPDLRFILEHGRRGSSAVGSGYGIGLSLVQRLCKRFGWQLALESRVNQGTRVEWRFPGEPAT